MKYVVTMLWCISISVNAQPFMLHEKVQQGALIRGSAEPNMSIRFNGEQLPLTDNGDFVFGIGRDDTGTIIIEWEYNNKQGAETFSIEERAYDIQRIDGLPPKMVTPSAETLARMKKDNAMVAKARAITTNYPYFSQSFIWPAEGPVSGVYGSQRVLNGEPRRPHFGVDVAGPVGTNVVAPADGVVTLFVPDMVYSGGTMIIDHGFGVSSTFLHLNAAHVKVGDSVKQGQHVADMGATGRATGSHLDWRINWGKVRVDPALLVPARP